MGMIVTRNGGFVKCSPVKGLVFSAMLARKLRCRARGRGRLIVQGSSAVWTIQIIYANPALALRTARTQLVIAPRAEVESGLHGIAAFWTGAPQRLPQYEIKNDAQSVGNKYGDNAVQTGFNFCPRCNHKLSPSCPQCQRLVGVNDLYCPYCGTSLHNQAAPAPGPATKLPG